MAIKISSTEVIDNSRVLQNIAGANGVCNNFHATAVAITTVLNFALPVMSLTMSGPVTFTESNKLLGRSALLLLDTSVTAYTPTFSANIKWQNATTPTWGDYRYWQIALVCVDGTNVRGIALGYEFTGSTLTLNGGSGGTVTVFDGSGGPYNTGLAVRFNTDGTVEKGTFTQGAAMTWVAAGNWITGGAFTASEYDVRFTNWADTGGGASENFDTKPVADDSWISLSSNRTWQKDSTTTDILNWSGDFEVRKNAGAPPATGSSSWTFVLENT
jgi:hypothetical protein